MDLCLPERVQIPVFADREAAIGVALGLIERDLARIALDCEDEVPRFPLPVVRGLPYLEVGDIVVLGVAGLERLVELLFRAARARWLAVRRRWSEGGRGSRGGHGGRHSGLFAGRR